MKLNEKILIMLLLFLLSIPFIKARAAGLTSPFNWVSIFCFFANLKPHYNVCHHFLLILRQYMAIFQKGFKNTMKYLSSLL